MAAGLRIVFAAPAFWPATAFGGPIPVLRRLAGGLAARGHDVTVLTTALETVRGPRSFRTVERDVDGARVVYLATPVHFRWMGIVPTAPLAAARLPRPDVAHVFGLRDPAGAAVAAVARGRRIPYLFEGLGMVRPKLRKVRLKRVLDAALFRPLMAGAALLVAASELERREYLDTGLPADRIAIRPNGFPQVAAPPRGAFRARLGLAADVPLVLSVGRIARGKGLELLADATAKLDGAHLAVVGPDDGHGLTDELRRRGGRIHLVGQLSPSDVLQAYADADVLALASAHENFGMVAAEAAAAGTAIVVTDRCGVAELLGPDAAIVVPYDAQAIRDALGRVLADEPLRRGLAERGRAVAAAWSWERVVDLQEELYRRVVA